MKLYTIKMGGSVAFTFAFFIGCVAQSTPKKTFQFMPLARIQAEEADKKLDRTQLPAGTRLEAGPDLNFLLRAAGTEDLTVIPVSFEYSPPPGQVTLTAQCGVFFLKPDGSSRYLPVVGPDPTADLCTDVAAVGAMPDAGPRPRLIFVFTLTSMHGDDYPQPYVLSWNAPSGKYEVDKKTSDWLAEQRRSNTVAQVRRLLAHHH
jgi:hypothetical protein